MKMDLSKEKKGEKYEWYLGGRDRIISEFLYR